MGPFLSILFDFATSPLGLPISALYEWAIMAVIGAFAFIIAYSAVGEIGLRGNAGSIAHWLIRFIVFLVLCGIVRLAILLVQNWQLSLMAFGGISAAVVLSVLAIKTMRKMKKHKAVSGNA